jgi:RNA polymerase sigma-70 factor (ECF subfamily)
MSPVTESDFLRLFVKNEDSLRAFARVLLPTWEAVDEAMQEASVVMWRKLGQVQTPDGFLPWAKVILRFEALRLRRQHARDRHVFSEEVLELLANEAAEVAEDVWESEREALRSCLASMNQHHRELVLAPYAGEGQVTRIAERTSRSVNSLYKLLGRLREKLLTCVESRLSQAHS